MSKIICISREYGSGGHEIAARVANRLGIPCLDKEIIANAIKKSGLPEEMLASADEKKRNAFLFTSVYEGKEREFYGMALNDILYELQKRFIRKEADKGDCIIVGRCAEEILKNTDHIVVNIFVTAPVSYRINRKMEETQTSDRKMTEKILRGTDKQRRAYYEYHTGKDWGIPHNYDVCLNSASMGIDRVVDLILEAYEKLNREVGEHE